jgi:2-polyprenyl-3-methyl-5-hydroxy-6-metoxy-1,4-benzoquinol methylase
MMKSNRNYRARRILVFSSCMFLTAWNLTCPATNVQAFYHQPVEHRAELPRLSTNVSVMNLTHRESHFEFGENWRSYSTTIDQKRIDSAIEGLRKLFPDGLAGKTFFDIGCGSGIHALAALSLGAASALAIDIDEKSISTTRALLGDRAPNSRWEARSVSIFEASTDELGQFDVVYSWGVLHHTGDMWRAIDCATKFVRPGGQFAVAIYSATACDGIWKAEKRLYAMRPAPFSG